MSIPLHLWLKHSTGSDIRGSSKVAGREGSIEVLSFSHGMSVPADATTGKLLGGRMHRPILIEKEIDRSTPELYMAAARGLTLLSAEIRWYRINDAGHEEEYFNLFMTNVKVVSISPRVPNIKDGATKHRNHFEHVEFRYEEIAWSYLDGNLRYKDAWSGQY